jgi:TRAP-type C4-dicarboxylate transport system substrate-binding protein
VFLETFRTFKANPVPMSFSELYGALEQKAVDGQENPYAVILSNKFFEVQKFVSATNHVYTANVVLISKKFWDRLSAAEHKIVQDAALEARDYERGVSRAAAQKAVVELAAKGMQVNQIAPAELARMREMVKPVYAKFAAEYDPKVVQVFNAELERIQKMK